MESEGEEVIDIESAKEEAAKTPTKTKQNKKTPKSGVVLRGHAKLYSEDLKT